MKAINTYNYRDTLKEYLLIKKEINPDYSLRSFARDLDMPSSNLSNVLKGIQGLSKTSATKIVEKLRIEGEEKDLFVDSVLALDARSNKEKILARGRLNKRTQDPSKRIIQEDYFKLISEWYYFTILELITLKEFNSEHSWIAENLEIEESLVDSAMERLVRLNLITKVNGVYESTNAQLKTNSDLPSISIKKHNMQILKKASDAIMNQNVAKREISTLTVAINNEDLDFVKNEIREFKAKLNKDLMTRAAKKGANRVYCLSMQFFDLLKGKSNE